MLKREGGREGGRDREENEEKKERETGMKLTNSIFLKGVKIRRNSRNFQENWRIFMMKGGRGEGGSCWKRGRRGRGGRRRKVIVLL